MRPDIWGPSAWFFLHCISVEYPNNPTNDDKQNMSTFIYSLGNVLPCEKCRNNYKLHLQENPLTDKALGSNEGMTQWFIDLHNAVNKSTNKKVLTINEAFTDLSQNINKRKNNSMTVINIVIIIIIVAVILVGAYLYRFVQ